MNEWLLRVAWKENLRMPPRVSGPERLSRPEMAALTHLHQPLLTSARLLPLRVV
jgi:hypothetical protein